MRTAIERGEFVPFVEPEKPVAEEEAESHGPEEVREVRHVVGYHISQPAADRPVRDR
ncbi:hypothetical protein [Streptomyces clavifer]|uniref:hypothetical protein n=1 Tax=Streptomyces clavifer TaxID=68188 RepID=UPI0033F04E4E